MFSMATEVKSPAKILATKLVTKPVDNVVEIELDEEISTSKQQDRYENWRMLLIHTMEEILEDEPDKNTAWIKQLKQICKHSLSRLTKMY